MSDRERRVVSDLNTNYLNAEALADIERLGVELKEGAPLTVCDYDADDKGSPAWLVAKGFAHFDSEAQAWQIGFTMDDVHWEPRQFKPFASEPRLKVWLDGWEWECCGERFSVGSIVRWDVMPISSEARASLAEPLGEQIAGELTHSETHHFDVDDEPSLRRTRGTVDSIKAVYWKLAPRFEEQGALYAVAESAVLEERVTGGLDQTGADELRFEGYIVDLVPA